MPVVGIVLAPNDFRCDEFRKSPSSAFGQLLVLTSTCALGITGTYLGDYSGILMDHRVEGFPFNIMRDPMYNGSTMCFLGTDLWSRSPAGLVLSGLAYVVYTVAQTYEGPFTDMIYSKPATKSQ